MRCLIVTCHPLAESLCQHLAARVAEGAKAAGWTVERLDLYGEGFAPAMTAEERASVYAEGGYDQSGLAAHVARLEAAEALVLVFPTWWFGLPAMLKGWVDRVWAPGIAYDHADALGPIRPRLTGLREVLVVTTLGSPEWVDWLVMRRPLRRILKVGLIRTCAPQARFRYLALHRAENIAPARLARFERRIAAALGAMVGR